MSLVRETVLSAVDGQVLTITLNRPEKRNALTPEMHFALQAAFDGFAADEALKVCLLTGAGDRAFCAGSDLGGWNDARGYPKCGYGGIASRFDLDKPVIALVNGLALGGGFELALACDIIIAAETASFGLPEPRVGAIALGGGIHRLVSQIGVKRAMAPLLTGRAISAAEGRELGFVEEVVPIGSLEETGRRLCRDILANAPLAVRLTKELAYWGLDQPTLADALTGQSELAAYKRWLGAEDTHEGPRAFMERRAPNWRGA